MWCPASSLFGLWFPCCNGCAKLALWEGERVGEGRKGRHGVCVCVGGWGGGGGPKGVLGGGGGSQRNDKVLRVPTEQGLSVSVTGRNGAK